MSALESCIATVELGGHPMDEGKAAQARAELSTLRAMANVGGVLRRPATALNMKAIVSEALDRHYGAPYGESISRAWCDSLVRLGVCDDEDEAHVLIAEEESGAPFSRMFESIFAVGIKTAFSVLEDHIEDGLLWELVASKPVCPELETDGGAE